MGSDPEKNVYGNSPLGGNSVEGTQDGFADVKTTEIQGVPLFYDPRVDNFISEQAIDDLDDRDSSLFRSRDFRREEEFRAKAGYVTP